MHKGHNVRLSIHHGTTILDLEDIRHRGVDRRFRCPSVQRGLSQHPLEDCETEGRNAIRLLAC